MKTIIGIIIAAIVSISNAHDIDKTIYNSLQEQKLGFNKKTTNEKLLRRTYLVLAGRIPTLEETQRYLKNPNHDELTLQLLNSEDFVQSFYNHYSNLFRIKNTVGGVNSVRFYPYSKWIKSNIRDNVPYDRMVNQMLTAEGKFFDNPATGYMLRDNGMPLDNLSYTMQVFLGQDVSCAQCHNDPFSHWTQMDFYKTAAFFARNNTRNNEGVNEVTKKIDAEIKEITGEETRNNRARQLIRANSFGSFEKENRSLKLPADYQYDDADPNSAVSPKSPFGDLLKEGGKKEFSNWLISQPHFALATSNRLWEYVMGEALIKPVNNISIDMSSNKELSNLLSNQFSQNYDVKLFLYRLVTSEFFKREASSPNAPFTGPRMRRMSAEHIWDSLVTIIGGVPSPISKDGYLDTVRLDLSDTSGKEVLKKLEESQKYLRANRPKNIAGFPMARASDLERPHDILKKFGVSDKELIDSSSRAGSVAQVLVLINGTISNAASHKDSKLMEDPSLDEIFLSTLNRLPSIQEKSALGTASPQNIIWAVLNSQEFLFIQ